MRHALLLACFIAVAAHAQITYLYSFGVSTTDGNGPNGDLVEWTDGSLYGTTGYGGTSNCGSIFRVPIEGADSAIASFDCATGSTPAGGLVFGRDGILYGTTLSGGAPGCPVGASCSTVFRVTPTGALSTVAQIPFLDGWSPIGKLSYGSDGVFYGTAFRGGAGLCRQPRDRLGCGAIFQVRLDGRYRRAADFLYNPAKQNYGLAEPRGNLVLGKDGNYYGVASDGGQGKCRGTEFGGCGGVYRFTPGAGIATVVDFQGSDGSQPTGAMAVANDGSLYGTTTFGGATGNGTVFQIDPQGVLHVLYSFDGSTASNPFGRLLLANDGNVYGATQGGGPQGDGTVFRVTPAGKVTLVYTFQGGSDGAGPSGGLIQGADGNLYGATAAGGQYGKGTVFQLSLGLKPRPPAGDTLNPSSGPVGTKVTMIGKNFVNVTSVQFTGGAAATPTVITPTLLTVVVPQGAMTGPLTIIAAAGSGQSAVAFTVTP